MCIRDRLYTVSKICFPTHDTSVLTNDISSISFGGKDIKYGHIQAEIKYKPNFTCRPAFLIVLWRSMWTSVTLKNDEHLADYFFIYKKRKKETS